MEKHFNFSSSDKKTTIHAVEWTTRNKPKAILQIAHGMAEHIMRYDYFARYLNKNGILVCGNDHIGHGKSAASEDDLGYFTPEDGHFKVVDDMHKLNQLEKKKYPGVPYFLLGHSMGSFMAREYCMRYGKTINGAIIMGTGQQPKALLGFVKLLCSGQAKLKGWHYRSTSINKMAFGAYNKRFQPIKTGNEWLTKNVEIQKVYKDDPLSGYTFTLNGFYNLFDVMSYVENNANISKVPKKLPILIVSGQDDPVGSYGKGPLLVRDGFKNAGVRDVNMKLYENDRHEILNEDNQIEVFDDIIKWILDRI